MAGALIWYGPRVLAMIEKKVGQNLDKAAIYLVNDVKRSFGSAPPRPRGFVAILKNISDKSWRHAFRSKPGEPPHVDTGTLRRSITWAAPAKLVRLVGSSLKPTGSSGSYALCLEYGTNKMGARPYLRPALARCRRALLKLIEAR